MATPEVNLNENRRFLNRRIFVLGGALTVFSAALATRMHFLQVKEANKFRMLADENRINIRLLPPTRGEIFDRNGVLLAGNKQNYKVSLIRDEIKNLDEVLWNLQVRMV